MRIPGNAPHALVPSAQCERRFGVSGPSRHDFHSRLRLVQNLSTYQHGATRVLPLRHYAGVGRQSLATTHPTCGIVWISVA